MKLSLAFAALLLAPVAIALPAAAHAAEAPTRFSVTVEGAGPDVVMIPGLMSSRAVWDEAVKSLGGKYRVHRVQIAGFAGEPAGPNADGPLLAPIVEQLAAYIRDNRLDRPAMVGHSMGGFLSLMLADRHPDLAGKLLIVDSLPFYSMMFGPQATPAAVEPQAARLRDMIANADDAAYRAQQAQSYASLVKTAGARAALFEQSIRSDRKVAGRAVYEIMTTDMRPRLPELKVPVTVAYATNAYAPPARITPLYESYKAAPGATLVEVPDSYHFITADQPARFAEILATLLGGR